MLLQMKKNEFLLCTPVSVSYVAKNLISFSSLLILNNNPRNHQDKNGAISTGEANEAIRPLKVIFPLVSLYITYVIIWENNNAVTVIRIELVNLPIFSILLTI